MKSIYATIAAGLLLTACNTAEDTSQVMLYPDSFPDAAQGDTLFGQFVSDPFRWLEDDLNPKTREWINAQNEVTQDFLSTIPLRDVIKERLTEVWNYERISAPTKRGDYYYFSKNDGLQNQSVVYRHKEGEAHEVFLDPNTFSEDGTTSLSGLTFSKDGSRCAYSISIGGSDWTQVILLDAVSKTQIGDTLKDVKFSGLSWKGNEGIFYSSYDKPDGSELSAKTDQHKLFFHQLNTLQKEDKLIFGGAATPRRYISGYVTEDQQFLIISAQNTTTGNELYFMDLTKENPEIVTVIDNFDNTHSVVHTHRGRLFIRTNWNAPNYRLIVAESATPQTDTWVDFIPETDMPLSVATGGGRFFASYLKDATTQVIQYNDRGQIETEIKLPGVGTASGFGAKEDEFELYYTFTNYINPPTIYKYNIREGKSELYRRPDVQFDPEAFESYQVFYESKDGTKIPMIITHKKGLKMNGKNPTMLYGYGGFNISLTPSFSTSLIAWLEQGGVYAVANLRGGGEYGKRWHDGGRLMNKQNVFDDCISAAEHLITSGYCTAKTLGVSGGSNGGLLVGACITQRPDLFAVALPAVGVLDMLRYHTFTAGAGWAYDYGTAEDSPEMLAYLLGYSPYHNLRPNNYPATMITTGDHDDRVVPAHSYKFAAQLQQVHTGNAPVLIRIETKAGHGAGKPTAMIIQEQADKWAFALHNMGVK